MKETKKIKEQRRRQDEGWNVRALSHTHATDLCFIIMSESNRSALCCVVLCCVVGGEWARRCGVDGAVDVAENGVVFVFVCFGLLCVVLLCFAGESQGEG